MRRTKLACPTGCGGVIVEIYMPHPFGGGDSRVASPCPVCEEERAKAKAANLQAQRMVEWRTSAGCERPEVWPRIAQHALRAAKALHGPKPGIVWVMGGHMAGKTTMAREWAHAAIDAGLQGQYVDFKAVRAMQGREPHAAAHAASGVEALALDSVGARLAEWEQEWLNTILSGRGGRWTLIASHLDPRDAAGMGAALGEEATQRILMLRKMAIRLPSAGGDQ